MERHLFKEIKRPGDPGKFGDVVSKLEQIPNWMAVSKQQSMDASIVSLRPPKLPSGMGSESEEKESIAPAAGSENSGSNVQDVVANDIDHPEDGMGTQWRC
jgi:hypothetical protein